MIWISVGESQGKKRRKHKSKFCLHDRVVCFSAGNLTEDVDYVKQKLLQVVLLTATHFVPGAFPSKGDFPLTE